MPPPPEPVAGATMFGPAPPDGVEVGTGGVTCGTVGADVGAAVVAVADGFGVLVRSL